MKKLITLLLISAASMAYGTNIQLSNATHDSIIVMLSYSGESICAPMTIKINSNQTMSINSGKCRLASIVMQKAKRLNRGTIRTYEVTTSADQQSYVITENDNNLIIN